MQSRSCTLNSSPPSSKAPIYEYNIRQDTQNISSSSDQQAAYNIPIDKLTQLNEIDDKIKAYQLKLDSIIKSHETIRNLIFQHFERLFAIEIHKYREIQHETLLTRRFISKIKNQASSELDNLIREYEENKIRGVVSLYQKLKPINIYSILHLFLDSFGINIENLYISSKGLKGDSQGSDVYQCEDSANLEKTISELKMILSQKEKEIKLERNARDLEVEGLRKQVKDKESEVIELSNQLQTITNFECIESPCKIIEELREYLQFKDDQLAKLTHEITIISEKKDQEINTYKLQLTQLQNSIHETTSDMLKVLTQQLESLEIPQNTESLHIIKDILHNYDTMLKDILKSASNPFQPINPDPILTPGEIPISKSHKSGSYCIICNKILDMDEFILSKCRHLIHSRCLKLKIQNCPECTSEILECDYIKAIDQSYNIISDIHKLCRVSNNLKQCPGGCFSMVSIENDSFIFDCPICKKAYCLKCKQEAHPGDICEIILDSWSDNVCRICSEEMTDNIISLRECRESFHIECLKKVILRLLNNDLDARCVCGAGLSAEDYTIIMKFD